MLVSRGIFNYKKAFQIFFTLNVYFGGKYFMFRIRRVLSFNVFSKQHYVSFLHIK